MQGTWILVADRARARILESDHEDSLVEVAAFVNPDSRGRGRNSGAERLPRVNESMGHARHAIEPHTPLVEKITTRFARLLADALQRGYDERRYDKLVLVAPPRFMGSLHGTLHTALRARVVSEILQDLTQLPMHALRERLLEQAEKP
ncbi:MAG TPA: host attachment protein [Rhodanobacteraceae bacterium]|nr:host attachment protein [Rhodanobacteraceae bacterium]